MLLIKNATVVHLYPPEVIPDVDVVINGTEISDVAVGAGSAVKADSTFDAKGKIVMPGLVCAHNHFYSGLARGILAHIPAITDFVSNLSNLSNLWWRLDRAIDEEILHYSGLVCCVEAIKAGCTSVVDHHASPSCIAGSLDILKKCFEQTGLRGVECYEATDRNGEEGMYRGIDENLRFAKLIEEERLSKSQERLVESMIGGHAPFTLSDRGLRGLGDAVEKTGRGFHIHVAEDKFDQSYTHRYYQKEILARLDDFGLLTDRSVLVHGIYLAADDVEILNKRDAFLVHNCRSNMNNSVGYNAMLDSVSHVGIGTDGIGSDIMEEVKFAYFKNRDVKGTLLPADFLRFMQAGNGIVEKAFGGGGTGSSCFGRIEAGYKADIAIFDYQSPTPVVDENVGGHVIFGMGSRDVDTVIINGNVIMENRSFSWDVDSVYREAQPVAKRLWAAMDSLKL